MQIIYLQKKKKGLRQVLECKNLSLSCIEGFHPILESAKELYAQIDGIQYMLTPLLQSLVCSQVTSVLFCTPEGALVCLSFAGDCSDCCLCSP